MIKKILLIGDLVGYGRIGVSAQQPIFSRSRYEIFTMPTSLVSNNFGYGDYKLLDTTEYINDTIQVWKKLKLNFDAVAIGFVTSINQILSIASYIDYLREENPRLIVLLDPIMGDLGKLYNGLDKRNIEAMRALCKTADVLTPNFTESCFLQNQFVSETSQGLRVDKKTLTESEALNLIKDLSLSANASVVITSAILENNRHVNIVCENQKVNLIDFQKIDAEISGTGDIFSAIVLNKLLDNFKLVEAVESTSKQLTILIDRCSGNETCKLNGIPIEYLIELV